MGDPAEETFCRPNLKLSKNLHRFSKSVSKTTNVMTIDEFFPFRHPYPYVISSVNLRKFGFSTVEPGVAVQVDSLSKLSSMNVVF